MVPSKRKLLAGAAAVVVAAAGCGSSSKSGSAGSAGGSSNGKTYTVGVLTDITGPAASGNKLSVQGVQAGAAWASSKHGYTIKYVVGDTTSSPSGALSAAQTLVEQDHVKAVIAISSLTFAAASFLTSHGVPVIGAAQDATEWQTAKNMFSVYGALHSNKVTTTEGKFLKMEGATSLGAIGYSISPESSEAAKSAAASAKNQGVKVGYLNASFPFGSTNVQPAALAMKSAGIDSFTATVDPNTAFAFISQLRNDGVKLKVAMLPTGYGGDLLQAGPGALHSAQNVYFYLGYEPIEMHTAATQEFASNLKAVGVKGDPTQAEYNGYASVILLVQALEKAGANASQSSLINALSGIHSFDAGGLFGSHSIDINDRKNLVSGPDNCEWFTKLSGSTFQLVSGADPVCGTVVPGVTVSASS